MEQDFLGRGWSFPVRPTPSGRLAFVGGEEMIRGGVLSAEFLRQSRVKGGDRLCGVQIGAHQACQSIEFVFGRRP